MRWGCRPDRIPVQTLCENAISSLNGSIIKKCCGERHFHGTIVLTGTLNGAAPFMLINCHFTHSPHHREQINMIILISTELLFNCLNQSRSEMIFSRERLIWRQFMNLIDPLVIHFDHNLYPYLLNNLYGFFYFQQRSGMKQLPPTTL